MEREIFCQLSRADGSTLEVWLPVTEVEVMIDLEHPDRMSIFEKLDVVSIEVDESVEIVTDQKRAIGTKPDPSRSDC